MIQRVSEPKTDKGISDVDFKMSLLYFIMRFLALLSIALI